jgi:hypothetical protein
MKKKVLVGVGVIASWVLVSFGTMALADNNFITQMTTDAAHKIVDHANGTTDKLVNNIDDDVKAKLQDKIDTKVDAKNQQVDSQLQDYYDKKIDDLVNGDNTAITQPLDATSTNVVVNNEKKIDKAFDELVNQ